MTQKDVVLAALEFYGESPIAGPQANEQIVAFLDTTTYPKGHSDEVPWCSAFLVYLFQKCGIATQANAAAVSWLNFGEKQSEPQLGDVVVLGWPVGAVANHHVGLFIREVQNGIYILAGNQNNTVDIALWKKADVLGYQRGA